MHKRPLLVFSFVIALALEAITLPLGPWEILDIRETKIGKNGLVVPLVILEPQEVTYAENGKTNIKNLLGRGKRLFLVVRLKNQELDVPVMVEGSIGLITPRSTLLAAQSVWPNEPISPMDDSQFMTILNNAEDIRPLVNKEGSEPRNVFNSSGFRNFPKDLKVLTESSKWRSLSSSRIERAHYVNTFPIRTPRERLGMRAQFGSTGANFAGSRDRRF